MKTKDEKFDTETTLGSHRLSAWAVSPNVCRIQTRDATIAKALRRLPDCEQVGCAVAGDALWLFAVCRTLPWVRVNVMENFASLFPKKEASNRVQNARHAVLIAAGGNNAATTPGEAVNEIAE